eukprot:365600-Chlamydomonas_euryale.AAC.9
MLPVSSDEDSCLTFNGNIVDKCTIYDMRYMMSKFFQRIVALFSEMKRNHSRCHGGSSVSVDALPSRLTYLQSRFGWKPDSTEYKTYLNHDTLMYRGSTSVRYDISDAHRFNRLKLDQVGYSLADMIRVMHDRFSSLRFDTSDIGSIRTMISEKNSEPCYLRSLILDRKGHLDHFCSIAGLMKGSDTVREGKRATGLRPASNPARARRQQ